MKIVLITPIVLLVALFMPVVLNQVPMFEDPGFSPRLKTYLTTNVAQTSDTHAFPELRTRIFDAKINKMFQFSQSVLKDLGWEFGIEGENSSLHAIVTSNLWNFKDDVVISFEAVGADQVRLHIKSSSRVGKGDFGANLAHILVFYRALNSKMVIE